MERDATQGGGTMSIPIGAISSARGDAPAAAVVRGG